MTKISHNFIDLTGQVFGRLTVIRRVPNLRPKYPRWMCKCECGNEIVTDGTNLREGDTKSCGCLRREMVAAKNKTPEFIATHTFHGLSRSTEYQTWQNILSRCENPNSASYYLYGAKRIQVCERWHDFSNFFDDMGLRPSNRHSIERKDNNGHYEPENCYWATPRQQARNRSTNTPITFNGETKIMIEWAETLGIKYHVLCRRLTVSNWSIEKAFMAPIGKRSKRK